MTVLYILSSLSTAGGTSAKIYALLKESRHDSVVIAPCYDSDIPFLEKWETSDVHLYRYSANLTFFQKFRFAIGLVRKHDVRIVHAFFPEGMYLGVLCCMYKKNLRLIRSIEGVVNRKLHIRLLSHVAFRFCTRVVCISHYVASFYKRFLRPEHQCIIYNCASNILPKVINNQRVEKCRLLCLCGLNRSKNIPIFPEIARNLKQMGFPFHMTICGDGFMREYLETKIKEYNLQQYISLPGNVPNPESYLEITDIYIHPADLEGFGLAVAEAMSAGKPIIVSNAGALPELIRHDYSGIIVEPYDARKWADTICMLYNSPEMMRRLGDNAHDVYTKRFTPRIFAERIDSLYDECL